MENKATNQTAETTGAEAVATQDTAGAVDSTSPSPSNFEEGGELKAGGRILTCILFDICIITFCISI